MTFKASKTVILHGQEWKCSDIEEDVEYCLGFKWQKKKWEKQPGLVSKDKNSESVLQDHNPKHVYPNGKSISPYYGQAYDTGQFDFVEDAWDHEHCVICSWTIGEHHDYEKASSVAYTNGEDWICVDCYENLVKPTRKKP